MRQFINSVFMIALAGMMAFTQVTATNLSNADADRYALQMPATLDGQSATLLPDGTWLLLGGEVNGDVTGAAVIEDSASGRQTTLPIGLNVPRAWHTATVLPNGQILIFGGVDAHGHLINRAEFYDPAPGVFLSPPPRV